MKTKPILPLALTVASMAACGGPEGFLGLHPTGFVDVSAGSGRGEAAPRDPHPSAVDMPRVSSPRAVAKVPGGGFSGGELEGVMTVFVESSQGAPVPGAVVRLANLAEAIGRTDDNGQIDFYGASLYGAVDVHVFAEGAPFVSMFEASQSVVTVALPEAKRGAHALSPPPFEVREDQELVLQLLPWAQLGEGVVQFGLRLEDGEHVLLDEQPLFGARPTTEGPYLVDELTSAEFWMSVLERSEAEIAGRPASERRAFRRSASPVQTIASMLEVPAAATFVGRALSVEPTDGASLHYADLVEPATGALGWRVYAFSRNMEALALPHPPEGLEDPLGGALLLELVARDLETDDWFSETTSLRALRLSSEAIRRQLIEG